MEMQELEITIDRQGNATVKVNGVREPGCKSFTRELEERIGEVMERIHTGEYYDEPLEVHTEETVPVR
jgi:hypothetical protein